jgi:hypothetical protein
VRCARHPQRPEVGVVQASGKRFWYSVSRKKWASSCCPANQRPCSTLCTFCAPSRLSIFTYTSPWVDGWLWVGGDQPSSIHRHRRSQLQSVTQYSPMRHVHKNSNMNLARITSTRIPTHTHTQHASHITHINTHQHASTHISHTILSHSPDWSCRQRCAQEGHRSSRTPRAHPRRCPGGTRGHPLRRD